ncbi:MAG: recombinase B, partial [Microcystis sp. M49629_WE12]|nr:recombinase B [Microcystis sp. M49629_WE12]
MFSFFKFIIFYFTSQVQESLTFLLDRMLLTDDLLLDYQRCQRRAFLNLYGNSQEKDP